MAPHSSTLARRILWTEEPGGQQSMGSQRVRHDWATSLSLFTFMHRRRKQQPTPVFLPGESQGWGSLVDCSPGGCCGSDMTEWLHFHALEKEMAIHSSVLAWRIPGTGSSSSSTSIHDYWKIIALTSWIFVGKIMCHLIARWELQLRIPAEKTKRTKQKFSPTKFQNSLECAPPFSLSLSPSPHLP